MSDKSSKNTHLRNDLILVAVIFAISLTVFAIFKLTMSDGAFVTVSVESKQKYCYSLSEDREVEIITGDNGEYKNTLVIKDRKAYVVYANCTDKICVNHKAISKTGETIVCLPHKVVVSIISETDGNAPDVVV